MRYAEAGIAELLKTVDTLLIIPNQNLFRVANEKTTFANAFAMADQVLYSGVACISDLIVKEGLINLDFADVLDGHAREGQGHDGQGRGSGEKRVLDAAVAAISNPLIQDPSIKRASGLIISITGGKDLTLYESMKRPPAYATRPTRTPTSSSARPSMQVSKVSSASRWWRPASIISARRASRSRRTDAYGSRRQAEQRQASHRRPDRACAPPPQFESPPLRPAARHPAPQRLDPYGRAAPARTNPVEEKVIDIPAFLGRKAN